MEWEDPPLGEEEGLESSVLRFLNEAGPSETRMLFMEADRTGQAGLEEEE